MGRVVTPLVVRDRSASSPPQLRETRPLDALQSHSFYISALAGALACSLTHTMVVPLDLIKTRIQTDESFKSLSTRQVFEFIRSAEGFKGLLQGTSAVTIGYFLQGAAKFGIYDKLKRVMKQSLTDQDRWEEHLKLPVYLGASAIAESVATLLLCPMEVLKIAIMTKKYNRHLNTKVSGTLLFAMDRVIEEGGKTALWQGLPWIMLRQVPYSCIKLAGYDVVSEKLMALLTAVKSKWSTAVTARAAPSGLQLAPPALLTAGEEEEIYKPVGVQILSGIVAGCIAAVVSQPADVLLSKICASPGAADAVSCVLVEGPLDLIRVVKELGLHGCFAGLQSRAVMVSTMTAVQFLIYEGAKDILMGMSAAKDN
jgi:solute carrier family 25 phosphate transporter 3